jgi:hypothetical protein
VDPRAPARFVAALAAAVVLCGPAADAAFAAHDFPTRELVQYVEACIRDRQGDRQELIYKCSCLMDRLTEQYTFDDWVERLTAAQAIGIAGERGSVVRSSATMQAHAAEFRAAEAKARRACFLE